jgi:4-hydroxybenzoate polyprenyltransferase
MTSKISNWITFTKERFPLLDHTLMIVLFVGGHLVLVDSIEGFISIKNSVLIFLAIFFFFFKMRLYDEIKDYELDCEINPTRPLPRGLLDLSDMKKGIATCIFLEIVLFSILGLNPLTCISFAIFYSLLMYKEFFIPNIIRPHLTTYAIVHTIVTVPMGIAIISGATGKTPMEMDVKYFYFVLSSWFVFNIFEFGRKTFTTKEERNAVESYSKIFTRHGAIALVVSMSACAVYTLFAIEGNISISQSILTVILLIIGLIFSFSDSEKFGKLYRVFSSVYIIIFYILFIIETKMGLLL